MIPSASSSFEKKRILLNGVINTQNEKRKGENKLRSLTVDFAQTYKKCNANFKVVQILPQRILTVPSDGKSNDGMDNEDANLICRVNDQILFGEKCFTILDLLGTGTFGQVFRCQIADTKEIVAVKVIKNKPAYHTQGMLEVKIARLLNSKYDPDDEKHIVRLLEAFEFKGHICLVFELLSMSLLDLLTQNQFRGLPLSIVQRFAKQILTGLVTLEEANIIHCDLKPENILLVNTMTNLQQQRSNSEKTSSSDDLKSKDLEPSNSNDCMENSDKIQTNPEKAQKKPGLSDVKIIDFGSACFEGRTVYSYIQSRFYRSPEVLLGIPYTGAIDIWSLGCVCVEMYLGLPLFPGVSQHNQLTRIIEMLGMPPDYLIEGKNGSKYFTSIDNSSPATESPNKDNDPSNPAIKPISELYRIKTAEEYAQETRTEVPVLRKYLRYNNFDDVIMKCPLPLKSKLTAEQKSLELTRRRCFLDFLKGLLHLDPFQRWTAKQAAEHPFIQSNNPFFGSFVPPEDLKLKERKLSFMVYQQQKQQAQERTRRHTMRAMPSNFSSGKEVGSIQGNFIPLKSVHKKLSDPSMETVSDQMVEETDADPITATGPMLKRGHPVHLRATQSTDSPSETERAIILDKPATIDHVQSKTAAATWHGDFFNKSKVSNLSNNEKFKQAMGVSPQKPGVLESQLKSEVYGSPANNQHHHHHHQKKRGSAPNLRIPNNNSQGHHYQNSNNNNSRLSTPNKHGAYNSHSYSSGKIPINQQQQRISEGTGPMMHNSYSVNMANSHGIQLRHQQQQQQMRVQQQHWFNQRNHPIHGNHAQNQQQAQQTLQLQQQYHLQQLQQQQQMIYGIQQQSPVDHQLAMMMQSSSLNNGGSLENSFYGYNSVQDSNGGVLLTDFGFALLRPDMDEQRRLLSQQSLGSNGNIPIHNSWQQPQIPFQNSPFGHMSMMQPHGYVGSAGTTSYLNPDQMQHMRQPYPAQQMARSYESKHGRHQQFPRHQKGSQHGNQGAPLPIPPTGVSRSVENVRPLPPPANAAAVRSDGTTLDLSSQKDDIFSHGSSITDSAFHTSDSNNSIHSKHSSRDVLDQRSADTKPESLVTTEDSTNRESSSSLRENFSQSQNNSGVGSLVNTGSQGSQRTGRKIGSLHHRLRDKDSIQSSSQSYLASLDDGLNKENGEVLEKEAVGSPDSASFERISTSSKPKLSRQNSEEGRQFDSSADWDPFFQDED